MGYRGFGRVLKGAILELQGQAYNSKLGVLCHNINIPDALKVTIWGITFLCFAKCAGFIWGLPDFKQQHNANGRGWSGESAGVSSISKQLHLKLGQGTLLLAERGFR